MTAPSHCDNYELPISTGSTRAAQLYRDGVALMLSSWPGAAELFEAAVSEDPDFALPHAALARLDAFAARPAQARAGMARARQLASVNATERERSHVAALEATITSSPGQALILALEHAARWPRDVMILGLPLGAFGLFAFSGMPDHDQARVDLCEIHASQFGVDDWWFLTYYGWALAENGEASRGRSMVEKAFDLRPANANAVHALAHALYEGDEHDRADTVIRGWLPGYDRSGLLHGHISWHAALNALERGDGQTALAIYLDSICPEVSHGAPINIVTDGASLLWRLDAEGHAVDPSHWAALADYSGTAFPRAGHSFTDAHMAFIEAATGNGAGVERRAEAIESMILDGAHIAGPVVPAICRAALAFAEADYRACASLLLPMQAEVARIGGSGAQRDVIGDMLLIALIRSGELATAHEQLDARLHHRLKMRGALNTQ